MSPVDSSSFPAVYSHHEQETKTVLPSLFTPRSFMDLMQQDHVVYDCELEPFEYRADMSLDGHHNDLDKETAFNSVFADNDLIDSIMCSLDLEQPTAALVESPRMMLPSFPPMVVNVTATPKCAAPMAPVSTSLPCIRKPGTFLNKDGRWIKGKPCRMQECDKRAQSNGLCKGHGGGARCNFEGCHKSSQGGGFCRAHGGGKRCLHEGCEKGTQRNGYCYLHGGVRSCSVQGCDKKDRGNGKCFSHGGGRKCQNDACMAMIRRGVYCEIHGGKK